MVIPGSPPQSFREVPSLLRSTWFITCIYAGNSPWRGVCWTAQTEQKIVAADCPSFRTRFYIKRLGMAFPDPRVALAHRKCTIYGATRADLVYAFRSQTADSGFREGSSCDLTGYKIRPFYLLAGPSFSLPPDPHPYPLFPAETKTSPARQRPRPRPLLPPLVIPSSPPQPSVEVPSLLAPSCECVPGQALCCGPETSVTSPLRWRCFELRGN